MILNLVLLLTLLIGVMSNQGVVGLSVHQGNGQKGRPPLERDGLPFLRSLKLSEASAVWLVKPVRQVLDLAQLDCRQALDASNFDISSLV